MTGLQPHFGTREQERLVKLFSRLGSDNASERETAHTLIDALLAKFFKRWDDLIELLGGIPGNIRADLVSLIASLGGDPEARASARRHVADLLERHRKTWNDLVAALCSTPEDWAREPPVDDPPRVDDLLGLIHYLLEEYVILKPHEYVAVALWILHTHVYDKFMVTPRLALRSPVAGCGKTVLLDVIAKLAARPEKFDSISTAALFRLIDWTHPTTLIDEADNLGIGLQPNGRLRALFNSGHRRGGTIAISERDRTRRYSTFAPLSLALPQMVGGLPSTLASRSITISMERASHAAPKRFDSNNPDPALDAAHLQILLWRREVELNPDPEMPAGIRNRFCDNWRPLISIADSLGWGEKAREAMIVFGRESQEADRKIALLTDLRKVFDASGLDALPTAILLEALHSLDGSEWLEPHKLRPSEMALMLRDFRITPRTVWPPNRTPATKSSKGYRRSQFEDAWSRYCHPDGTPAQPSNINRLGGRRGGTV